MMTNKRGSVLTPPLFLTDAVKDEKGYTQKLHTLQMMGKHLTVIKVKAILLIYANKKIARVLLFNPFL